jgi:hypothetical protein
MYLIELKNESARIVAKIKSRQGIRRKEKYCKGKERKEIKARGGAGWVGGKE